MIRCKCDWCGYLADHVVVSESERATELMCIQCRREFQRSRRISYGKKEDDENECSGTKRKNNLHDGE